MEYKNMSREALQAAYEAEKAKYEGYKAQGMKLNIARGKPGAENLDLVTPLLTVLSTPEDCIDDGLDVRNYGELSGVPSAKRYWAEILGCRPENVFVGGNSSLNMIYDFMTKVFIFGLPTSPRPWSQEKGLKWICPAPGYDRHFLISEKLGFELITVPMTEDGPNMDMVEDLIKDPLVKGMWNVPKYSNPGGVIYSEETVNRIASMKPAAPDFVLIWDNAYCIHELKGDFVPFPDILGLCEKFGNDGMAFEFSSTSKITYPGAGFSVMASSEKNIEYLDTLIGVQTISYDKMNQLRHVRFLKDKAHTLELMKKHAAVLGPKFAAVDEILHSELDGLGIGEWNEPTGGYFVSFNAVPGTAKRINALCKEAGLVMTGAGATFPYGKDPADSNLRIAPSYPPLAEVRKAMEVFCCCVRLASLEKFLAQ